MSNRIISDGRQHGIVFVLVLMISAGWAWAIEPTLEELQTEADRVMAVTDKVEAQAQIQVVWDLVDRLTELGRDDERAPYLEFGIKHKPGALDYQLVCARWYQQQGRLTAAETKARAVMDQAETDALINEARDILRLAPLDTLPSLSAVTTTGPSLVLVPIGAVDTWLLRNLQSRLADCLGIQVLIQDAGLLLPPPRRDAYRNFLQQGRRKLMSPELIGLVEEIQINLDRLNTEADVLAALRAVTARMDGDAALHDYDRVVARMRDHGQQWDIKDLCLLLHQRVKSYKTKHTAYLGVASVDCFSNQSNYIFGVATNGQREGVISYARFTAAFNDTPPSQERLTQRSLKQALATTGFMYNVPRCSHPTCARAYPHSLEQHDAKSVDLCDDCRNGLAEVLGQPLPDSPEL